MPSPYEEWGTFLTAVASCAMDLTAFIAIAIAYMQIRENRRLSAEDAYLNFSRLGFDYPELAEPSYEDVRADRKQRTRYHWYVMNMLSGMERILITFPNDRAWMSTIMNDLELHRDYLCSPEFDPFLRTSSRSMQKILLEFRKAHGVRAHPGGPA